MLPLPRENALIRVGARLYSYLGGSGQYFAKPSALHLLDYVSKKGRSRDERDIMGLNDWPQFTAM